MNLYDGDHRYVGACSSHRLARAKSLTSEEGSGTPRIICRMRVVLRRWKRHQATPRLMAGPLAASPYLRASPYQANPNLEELNLPVAYVCATYAIIDHLRGEETHSVPYEVDGTPVVTYSIARRPVASGVHRAWALRRLDFRPSWRTSRGVQLAAR